MPVAALTTLGCKVNQYETEKIAEEFAASGFTLTDFDAPADVYVINSCSVTQSADRKSRYLARKASRTNPDAMVVMTGCHSQMTIDSGGWVEGATMLVPNDDKMRLFEKVIQERPSILSYSSSPATVLPGRPLRTRAAVKVQDGCEHYCGFCSIPYTRKTLRSRPASEVIEEARCLGELGTKEIIVTGICVGAYGPSTGSGGPDLAQLLLKVADQPGVERVRLSSIQPIEVTDDLIDTFAAHPNLCPHLHLSCQSGDDDVLAAMNRPYSTKFFKERVARLRESVPGVAITTDLIVGYPGETRAMHENTIAFAREVAFQRTHVFRYSPRPRTHGESLPDDVSDGEKRQRHAELQEIVNQTNRSFTERYIGEILPVLVEGRQGGEKALGSGHTPNYISVAFESPRELVGQVVPVRLTGVTETGDANGEIAQSDSEIAFLIARTPRRAETNFLPLQMADA